MENITKMLECHTTASSLPSFFAGHNFGRGLFSERENLPFIVSSNGVTVWRVVENNLTSREDTNVLYDGENYVIEWKFSYVLKAESEIKEEIVFFHWKGMNALKGFSPLPPTRDLQDAIVERIYQWGEPPVFFHIFPEKLIVLNGKEKDFDHNIPHLLMLRGEMIAELHLFEVPCSWKNFRSKAIFFLIVPDRQLIYMWFGSSISSQLLEVVNKFGILSNYIKDAHESWKSYEIIKVEEGSDDMFAEILGKKREYLILQNQDTSFSPKLFYLVHNGNDINPVPITYPLRTLDRTAPFPFLQSHLYSAPPGSIFLLDNNTEVWLWKGLSKTESDDKTFDEYLNLAKELAKQYTSAKTRSGDFEVVIKETLKGDEPIKFTNIFPYWKF